MRREPWMDDAACLNKDPELFFASENSEEAPARKVCYGDPTQGTKPCRVMRDCLVWTLMTEPNTEVRYGFFGGMAPADRTKIMNNIKEKAA
jgi:hypothetical protein